MKLLVCGSRSFLREDLMRSWLDRLIKPGDTVIHGGARGADEMAGKIAHEMGCEVQIYPALWDVHGRAAGPIRNQQMLDEGKPDLVLAFPGVGKGTWDMMRRATKAGVKVLNGMSSTEATQAR